MERGDGDAVLAAHIGGAKVILLPRQDPHDLLFVEPKPRRPNVLPNFTDSSKISRRFRGSDQIGPNSPDLRPGSTSFSFRDGSRCLARPAASSSTNSASNIGLSSPVCRRGGPGSPNRPAISTRSARTRFSSCCSPPSSISGSSGDDAPPVRSIVKAGLLHGPAQSGGSPTKPFVVPNLVELCGPGIESEDVTGMSCD